jgi:hypothetical protein
MHGEIIYRFVPLLYPSKKISQNRGNCVFSALLTQHQNDFEEPADQGHVTQVMH